MKQVVVIQDEYGVVVYTDSDTEVLKFELSQYEDELPDKIDLQRIRIDIDQIKDRQAKLIMEEWYKNNYTDWDEEERAAKESKFSVERRQLDEYINKVEAAGYKVKFSGQTLEGKKKQ